MRGGKLGQGVGVLKKGRWKPLETIDLFIIDFTFDY